MQIFGFKISRASDKEIEDLTLGVFNADGTVNHAGIAMSIINLRSHIGKLDGKLMVITALLVLQMGVQFPWVRAILAPAAALAQSSVFYVGTHIEEVAQALSEDLNDATF